MGSPAWVQIPLVSLQYYNVLFFLIGDLAQLVERVVRNDKAPGSKLGISNEKNLFLFFSTILVIIWANGLVV